MISFLEFNKAYTGKHLTGIPVTTGALELGLFVRCTLGWWGSLTPPYQQTKSLSVVHGMSYGAAEATTRMGT